MNPLLKLIVAFIVAVNLAVLGTFTLGATAFLFNEMTGRTPVEQVDH